MCSTVCIDAWVEKFLMGGVFLMGGDYTVVSLKATVACWVLSVKFKVPRWPSVPGQAMD